MSQDVSDLTKIEQELLESREELERRVEKRTATLVQKNEQLEREIAELKRLSQSLQSSEERFRAISESARDCIYIKDRSLRYIQVNPAVEKLLGVPASRIVGRTAEEVFGKEAGSRLRVEEIMTTLASEMQLSHIPQIENTSWTSLVEYDWPGNIRELRNVLERALMLWDRGALTLTIPELNKSHKEWSYRLGFPKDRSLDDVTDDVIRGLLLEALKRCQGSKKGAARLLRVSRGTLYRHLRRLGIAR
jgi:transcriptional regulator with PAS, ATPase and Fis domain